MAKTTFTPFEPKATNRFIFYIDGIASYLIKATDLPNIDNGEIVIDYINVDFKVKGKSRWQDINITLYDPVDPTGAEMVHNWINLIHNSDDGKDGFAFDDYKKDIIFKYVDPKGNEFEEWKLYGAFIGSSNWGSMDWANGDAVEIQLGIKYDYAILS
jgi:hypothetical protein